jgi:hypothetical protein
VVSSDDLPVNPLSFMILTIRANVLAALTLPTLANLLGVFTSVQVLFRGQAILSLSLADLAALGAVLFGRGWWRQPSDDGVINNRTGLTVIIPLTRRLFWPMECFPATRRGELQLQLSTAAAFTAIATPVIITVETVELLDVAPERFMKVTSIARTPTAAGQLDLDLPIGLPIAGALLFGTTVPTGVTDTTTIDDLRLLIDNVEYLYAQANWEAMHGELMRRTHLDFVGSHHVHRLAAGAPAGDALVEGPQYAADFMRQYAYLDFDPLMDGSYMLETEGRSRVHLRITAGDVNALRVLPVELMPAARIKS